MEKPTAEQILRLLSSQSFQDWYEGDFVDYIAEGIVSKEDILKDIRRMFELP